MATLTYKNKKYELPAKSIPIIEAEETMHSDSQGLVEEYLKQLDFLKVVFDDETLIELLGSVDANVIDFTEVTLLCNMIDSAYMEKIQKQQMSDLDRIANSVSVNKIIKASESVKKNKK